MTRIAFFSLLMLEVGGGNEKYVIETTTKLQELDPDIQITIFTLNDRLSRILQILTQLYFFKIADKRNLYRIDSETVLKRLGNVTYVKLDSLLSLSNLLEGFTSLYSKNEILDILFLNIFARKVCNHIKLVIGSHTPLHYPNAITIQDKLHNFLYTGWPYRSLLPKFAHFHVFNQSDEHIVHDVFHRKSTFIPHPIDPDHIQLKQTQNDDTTLRVAFLGRFTAQKGLDILLETIKGLHQKGILHQFTIRVAGAGQQQILGELKEAEGSYPELQLLGQLDKFHANTLYQWSDVVIIPSRFESFSYIALETACFGKIALASDIPGPNEIIINNETGFTVPVDASHFQNKLESLAQLKHTQPKEFWEVGQKALTRANTTYSPFQIYPRLITLLKS